MPEVMSAVAGVVADVDPAYAALALCLVAFGSMVQASLGMGFGLAAAPLLAIIDHSLVPAVPLLLATIVAVMSALKVRGSIQLSEFRLATTGRLLGTIVAAAGLSYVLNPEIFSMIFATCVLIAVILNAFSLEMKFNSRNLFAMGVVSGVMATISSVGAPPMALLYKNRPPLTSRATLSAFFALGGLLSVLGLWTAGWLALREIVLSVLLLPGVFLGTWSAARLQQYVDRRFSWLLMVLVCISATILMLRAIFA